MTPHSSTLAWKIPWMEEPGRLQSMGLHSNKGLSSQSYGFSSSPVWMWELDYKES